MNFKKSIKINAFLAQIVFIIGGFTLVDSSIFAEEFPLSSLLSAEKQNVLDILKQYHSNEIKFEAPEMKTGIIVNSKRLKPLKSGDDLPLGVLLHKKIDPIGEWLISLGKEEKDPFPKNKGLVSGNSNNKVGQFEIKTELDESRIDKNSITVRVENDASEFSQQKKQSISKLLVDAALDDAALDVSPQLVDAALDISPQAEQSGGSDDLLEKLERSMSVSVVSGKQQGQVQEKKLVIQNVGGQIKINLKNISGRVGEKLLVQVLGFQDSLPSLFVRDPNLLEWSFKDKELNFRKDGKTEIFVLYKEQMTIVPVQAFGNSSLSPFEKLQMPKTLSSLQTLERHTILGKMNNPSEFVVKPFAANGKKSSIWHYKNQGESNPFYNSENSISYKKIRIQLIDERSLLPKKEIIPAKGVRFNIVGTEFFEVSNAKGMSSEIYVPEGARFLLKTVDKYGYYQPNIYEIDSQSEIEGNIVKIKLMQTTLFESLAEISGVVHNSRQHGSFCGHVVGESSNYLKGISVKIFGLDLNPVYFNSYGFPDKSLVKTGPDGRFCFLGIDPGPIALDFLDESELLATVPINVFSGHHFEQNFMPMNRIPIRTRLASTMSAYEYRNLPEERIKYTPIDMVDLLGIGEDIPFKQEDFGLVSSLYKQAVFKGRSCYVSATPEFENAHYCIDDGRDKRGNVTTLVPNGFVESMSAYYNVELELDLELSPTLGTVIAEHGYLLGQEKGKGLVNIQLINEFGKSVGEGVHFGEYPVTRAIFFNIDPGLYTIVVKTADGFWLAINTVTVYSKTLSFIRTGSQLKYQNVKLSNSKK